MDYDDFWHRGWDDAQRYGPLHRIHREVLLGILKELDFESLIDVGCGNGVQLRAIRQLFPQVRLVGADISQHALAQVKEILPDITTHHLDATGLASTDRYDMVICCQVLEHIEDDVSVIAGMCNMTKKYVLVTTLQGRMRDCEVDVGHVRNYRYGELQRKMEDAGLMIEKTVQWGWPFYSPIARDLFSYCGGQQLAVGTYGLQRRILCRLIYALYRLNRSRKGDLLFVLGRKR
jgi:SAM-dependent methyltransferase